MIDRGSSSSFQTICQSNASARSFAYSPIPLKDGYCGNAGHTRGDRWAEAKTFMQERQKSEWAAEALAQRETRQKKQLARLEKKKQVLDDVLNLSTEELKEQLFQAKKNHWTDLFADLYHDKKRRPERKNTPATNLVMMGIFFSSVVFGVQCVTVPVAVPPALLFYHFTDNIIEKRLKKALLAPEKLEAERAEICLKMEQLRQR